MVVQPWQFELDGPQARVRKGSCHEAVLALMSNKLQGETPISTLRKELGLARDVVKDLQAVLRDEDHTLTKALADIGVSYVSTGKGRGARSFLLKR